MYFRKTLISFLTLLLILMPYAVFAESSEKEITYLSIGDSLAAGMLSDRSIGEGYVGKITSQLESLNYDVTVHKLGVPGYKTEDVLQQINNSNSLPDNADIVTITVGANDLLSGLDLEKISSFNPERIEQISLEIPNFIEEISEKQREFESNYNRIKSSLNDLQKLLIEIEIDNLPEEVKYAIKNINSDSTLFSDQFIITNKKISTLKDLLTESNINNVLNELSNLSSSLYSLYVEEKRLSYGIDLLLLNEMFDDNVKGALQQVKSNLNEFNTILTTISGTVKGLESVIKEYKKLLEISQEMLMIFDELMNKNAIIGNNLVNIIENVQKRYPNAKIYVMGYYNALPYFSPSTQEYTLPLIHFLNNVIKRAVDVTESTYVSTFETFEGNYEVYLPNREDIHPSDAGYVAIADAFFAEISKSFPGVPAPAPIETEVNVGETIEVNPGQLIKIKGTNVQLIIPNSIQEGTTLKVTTTDEAIIAKASNLKAVGAVLHFEFESPLTVTSDFSEGETMAKDEELFILIFGYEHDSADVAVYHFDDDGEQWTKIDGEVNEESKEVTVRVNHFSNYGVFAQVEQENPPAINEPEQPEDPAVEDEEVDEESVVKIEDDNKKGIDTKSSTLPKTATNIFNLVIIGTAMVISGITLYVLSRRKKFSS